MVVDPLPGHAVPAATRSYFDSVCDRFALHGRAALVPAEGAPYGVGAADLALFVSRTTAMINLSGRWRDQNRFAAIPVRVYVDLDPGFTQIWHEQGTDVGLAGHTHYLSVGAALADPAYTPATPGVTWQATLPPVVLEEWPLRPPPADRTLSTVANWRSYGPLTRDGVHYGQKAHAFRALEALPEATDVPLHIALSIDPGDEADRQRLVGRGWRLDDPVAVAGSPDRYRHYVQGSWAELGVAKSGYVNGRTGWVSDRSACYLASGRPVVASDTGLGGVLPVGEGIVPFDGVDAAASAIAEIAANYDRHAAAARRIAIEHLDSALVLRRLMTMVLT
jgi:hypothetical protein